MNMQRLFVGRKTDQEGFVSIIAAMFLMIILSLVVIGFSRVMLREERQSLDRQLARQALYAAESGINEVAQLIVDPASNGPYDLTSKADCDVTGLGIAGNGEVSADGSVAYTCVLFDKEPGGLEYSPTMAHSKIAEIETGSANSFSTLTVSWGNSDSNLANNDVNNLPACGSAAARDLPPDRGNAPPVLKFDLTQTGDPGDTYSRNNLLRYSDYLYLVPCQGVGSTSYTYDPDNTPEFRGKFVEVACSGTAARPCSVRITGMQTFNASRYFMRFRPIYTDATVTISGTQRNGATGTDDPIRFRDTQMIIDVTAKANDVVRRLRAAVPIDAPSNPDLDLPEAVLQGFDNVCKQIDVVREGPPALTYDSCIE